MKVLNKSDLVSAVFVIGLTVFSMSSVAGSSVAPSPNGIEFPAGYQDWRIISTAHRLDNKTMRIIYGNDKAIAAARTGQTNPWPDGAILGKVVFKQGVNNSWPAAIAPDKFVHAEFMIKNKNKYSATGGWGWARWKGMDQKPYGKDANVAQECVTCHTPVKSNDWVFTHPVKLPQIIK